MTSLLSSSKQNGGLITVLAKFDATKATTGTAALPTHVLLPKLASTADVQPDIRTSRTTTSEETVKCCAMVDVMNKVRAGATVTQRGGRGKRNNTRKAERKVDSLGCRIYGCHKFTKECLKLEANSGNRPTGLKSRFA